MNYRTKRLRAMDADLHFMGGLRGYYQQLKERGYSRRVIADRFGLSVSGLANWISKWNKEGDKPNAVSK